MNKKDLAERLAEEHELTKVFARQVVEDIFAMMAAAALKGESVFINGLGTFKVAERAARKGRNPRTGEAVKIAASRTLKFSAARSLKANLNTRRRGRKKA